ncbi:MAG: hypothetical protein ACLVHV_04175 [Oscillospiraceae bacterium]
MRKSWSRYIPGNIPDAQVPVETVSFQAQVDRGQSGGEKRPGPGS